MKKTIKTNKIYKKILILGILAYVMYIFIGQQKTLTSYKNTQKYYSEQLNTQLAYQESLYETKSNINSKEYIEKNFDKIEHSDKEIMNLIKSAMDYANKAVYEKAKANEGLEQMGTTLEICIIYNSKAYIGHIGDSRIYRIRKNIIRRITTDHS